MNLTDFIGTIGGGIALFCIYTNSVFCQLISGRDTSQFDKLLHEKQ
jgi:hypothetical protein